MALVDLSGDWATSPANPYATVFAEVGYPQVRRLDTGVYEGARGGLYMEHLVVQEYPFDPAFDKNLTTEERIQAVVAQHRDDTPCDYGVCDSYTQVLDRWPSLLTDERNFVVSMTEVRKADQPPHDGWRWHKNGEYIGTGDPQWEYLADEPDFESVWMFHVIEVTAPPAPQFTHDHDGCVYLGIADGTNGLADLYWCSQGGRPTVIARFSAEDSDYSSGMALADHDPYLGVARDRALRIGLTVSGRSSSLVPVESQRGVAAHLVDMTDSTKNAPDWYLDHFVGFGYSRESLNRTWQGLSDEARANYRRVLTGA